MPRETKAEREVRERIERINREREELAEYPSMVIAALERATHHDFKIRVVGGKFIVEIEKECTTSYGQSYYEGELIEVTPFPTTVSETYGYDELISELMFADKQEAEAQRIVELRASAVAKLTPEELSVLLGEGS